MKITNGNTKLSASIPNINLPAGLTVEVMHLAVNNVMQSTEHSCITKCRVVIERIWNTI